MKYFYHIIALCVFSLLPAYGQYVLSGKVIKVSDGDTFTLEVGSNTRRIRLSEIDAPENNQPWGNEATTALSTKVLSQEVQVMVTGIDQYGRTLGKVFLNEININRWLISEGHAWVYQHYSQDETLIVIETKAREANVGLWSLADAIPPWDWRKGKGN